MSLNLQYQNGHLLVFVLRDKNTNEIYGILDNLDSSQNKIFKLSKIGVVTNNIKIECYRVLSNWFLLNSLLQYWALLVFAWVMFTVNIDYLRRLKRRMPKRITATPIPIIHHTTSQNKECMVWVFHLIICLIL